MSGVSAEVERIDVTDDAIVLTGGLVGAEPGSAELIARRRDDGHEARAPAQLEGDRFEAGVPFRSLPWRDDAEP